jgi:DNA adenine methylase
MADQASSTLAWGGLRPTLSTETTERLTVRKASPFLKWVGGKQQLLDAFRPLFPATFKRYFEPFVGGGAVFFDIQPKNAFLSDANEELINCFTMVRDHLDELLDELKKHHNTEEHFYKIRRLDPSLLSPVVRASRFIYLNRTCYNGLYRVNKQGHFNAPFGRYENPVIRPVEKLRAAHHALQGVDIRASDFREALQKPKAGDFVYLDPPYDPLGGYSDFRRYHRHFFDKKDHEELAALFRELHSRGCLILLSNSETSFIRSLYEGWHLKSVPAQRRINCDPTGRSGVNELIVTNYKGRTV